MKSIFGKKICRQILRRFKNFFRGFSQKERNIFVGIMVFGCLLAIWFLGVVQVLPIKDPFDHSTKICRIDAYGASHEDPKKTREAFRSAFSDCAPGGTVVVPFGTWKTGGITIPGEVTLRMDFGSRLFFSDDPREYLPVVATRWEGMDVMSYQPLVYVPNAKNVAIIGRGLFIGNGGLWWSWKDDKSEGIGEQAAAQELYLMAKDNVPIEERLFGEGKQLRPSFLQFYNAENVVVNGPTFVDGPMWTIHPVYSKNITIRNIKVSTTAPNTDGIAIDSSENVLVEGCDIGSGDDAIVIKSGLDYDGWKQNRPSRHIVIQNSQVIRGNAGVTIGSEMSGGVEDVLVKNMRFRNVDTGIRLKTLRGRGGYVRNIRYENIDMRDLAEDAVQLDMKYKYATLKSESDAIPEVSNISLKNIFVRETNRAFRVGGREDMPIRNLSIENSSFFVKETGRINDTIGAVLKNVSIQSQDGKPIEVKNANNLILAGYFSRGGRGSAFVKLGGLATRNVLVGLWPCPKNKCVTWDKKVSPEQIIFE